MRGGLGSRLGSAGLMAGVVVAMAAGSSEVAGASDDLGGCIHYAPGERGGPTNCSGWRVWRKNLSGRDFTGADFSNAQFGTVDLRGTNFTNADLTGLTAMSPNVDRETQLNGAATDKYTYFDGLVADQDVEAGFGADPNYHFILGGVDLGLPSRFQPPAVVQGVTIDECTTENAAIAREPINGQQVDVRVLIPGQYRLRCTFFTAGRQNGGRGTTPVRVNVHLNRRPKQR